MIFSALQATVRCWRVRPLSRLDLEALARSRDRRARWASPCPWSYGAADTFAMAFMALWPPWPKTSLRVLRMENAYQELAASGFRQAARQSMLRANLFAMECVAILSIYGWFLEKHVVSPRRQFLLTFGLLYMARLNLMARCLLPRELAIEELTVVPVWISVILCSIGQGAASASPITKSELVISSSLYCLGS